MKIKHPVFSVIFLIIITVGISADAVVKDIRSSSYLTEDFDYFMYHPVKVLDGNPESAWLENAPKAGIDEHITISFAQPVTVDSIGIMGGYFDKRWFKTNNRLKQVSISLDDVQYAFSFDDKMEEQVLKLGKLIRFSVFKITIKDIYKSVEWDDTALAEISFYLSGEKIDCNLSKYNTCLNKYKADDAPIHLYKIKQNEHWGYIDNTGAIVIQPVFLYAGDFSEGLASFTKKIPLNNGNFTHNQGYINKSGKIKIDGSFQGLGQFKNGRALIVAGDLLNGKSTKEHSLWEGYIDRNGNVIEWLGMLQFDMGVGMEPPPPIVAYLQGGKWGYRYDGVRYGRPQSSVVITPKYDKAFDFRHDLALVMKDGTYFVIDQKEKIIAKPEFTINVSGIHLAEIDNVIFKPYDRDNKYNDFIFVSKEGVFYFPKAFSDGLACVFINGKYGYYNERRQFVIAPQFESAFDFHEGLATIIKNEKHGAINKTGDIVIQPQFSELRSFNNGRAAVCTKKSDKKSWDFIDPNGNKITNKEYYEVAPFSNGLAFCWFDYGQNRCEYIDTEGNVVWKSY